MKKISFNSYKGGACRTTTCYNTIPYLAQVMGATEDEPILIFDVDLDSYGMTSLLADGDDRHKEYSARNLFVDDDYGINKKIKNGQLNTSWYKDFYSRCFVKVGKTFGLQQAGAILFCGANPADDTISDEQFKLFRDDLPLDYLLSGLAEMEEGCPKAVVFDCAAGVQQTTRNVLKSITDAVLCMRPTAQFRMGTRDYLISKIPKILVDSSNDFPNVVLLPTAVAPIHEPDDADEVGIDNYELLTNLRAQSFKDIESDIVKIYKARVKNDDFLGYILKESMLDFEAPYTYMGIPEIERFKWTEARLLSELENMSEQEKLLEGQYKKLANILAGN